MTDSTKRSRVLARHGVVRYPRPEQTPNTHHGPSIVADFAELQRCGEQAAKKRLEQWRVALADIVAICRTNPVHREWLARTIAEAVAVCCEPVEHESPLIDYANADAATQPALTRWQESRDPADARVLLRTLRTERAANADLEAHVLRQKMEVVR